MLKMVYFLIDKDTHKQRRRNKAAKREYKSGNRASVLKAFEASQIAPWQTPNTHTLPIQLEYDLHVYRYVVHCIQ